MTWRLSSFGRPRHIVAAVAALVGVAYLTPTAGAVTPQASKRQSGTVLQTNLVSDLPGVADVTDPNLVNPWGISASGGSPLWISDNNSGLSTLYTVPGAESTPVSIDSLVVGIPNPVSPSGGTPTGTVFNTALASGAFQITGTNGSGETTSAPAVFLFVTEDGTIVGWNPGINPTQGVIAVDNSGNNFTNPDPNQQTGAVYKGLAIETASTPIVSADANSTALLYAANFRDARVDVYDSKLQPVTLAPGAFQDHQLPAHYAPWDVQALGGKIYVSYAKQNATRHDDVPGPHSGFVDVFNPDGSPGLPGGRVRLISRGPLDAPWGLAIAPAGFAGLSAPNNDPVLLVGNFGDGFVNAFDSATGEQLGQLTDPDGEPIQIEGLWALRVGNGGSGGAANTVYFTAGPFEESHGVLGSLATAAPGSPEGPAEAQLIIADQDVLELAREQLLSDSSSGASVETITQDLQTLQADFAKLAGDEQAFADDARADSAPERAGKGDTR